MAGDENLRALERDWLESGSVESELAYLVARVRGGDLSVAKVRLAAYLGHEAALAAGLELWKPRKGKRARGLQDWARGVSRADLDPGQGSREPSDLGRRTQVRVAIAWARHALSVWETALDEEESSLGDLLSRSEKTFLDPDLPLVIDHPLGSHVVVGLSRPDRANAAAACVIAAVTEIARYLGYPVQAIQATGLPGSARRAHLIFGGATAAKAAAAQEVVPWLLEYSDPLEERVRGD